jgi:hypothetical protein
MNWFANRKSENLVAAAISFICLAVYVPTVCPIVSFTDNGELATVATTLSIAHPTGYPLFTLLGRIASMIPIVDPIIYRLNLFAAFVTAVSIGVFFKVVREMQRTSFFSAAEKKQESGRQSFNNLLSAIGSSLLLAFSSTVWSQATSLEVYALHLLLILLAMFFFIRGVEEQLRESGSTSRNLMAFSFVLGLSFTNHMTTVLLAPGFLYLYFAVLGGAENSWRRLMLMTPFFILGLSVYLFLPIRSSSNPPLDWGNIDSLERFWWHVSGKQYRVWMFEGWSVAKKQLAVFVNDFSSEFSYPSWLFIAFGFANSWRAPKRFVLLLLLFATCLLYSVNYDIHDINSYFLLAFVSVALVLCSGFARTFWVLPERLRKGWIFASFTVGLVAVQFYSNRSRVDASEDRLASSIAVESLEKLPPNALVISGLWDFFVSPMYYFQIVEGKRNDIVVVDKSLLQNRVWYFNQLRMNFPEIYARSEREIETFLIELEKFEHGTPYEFRLIQSRWNELLSSLVRANLADRPVFVDWRIQTEFDQSLRRTPNGYFVQLSSDSLQLSPVYWKSCFFNPRKPDDFSDNLKRYLTEILVGNIKWLTQNHKDSLVRPYLHDLEALEPSYAALLRRAPEKR